MELMEVVNMEVVHIMELMEVVHIMAATISLLMPSPPYYLSCLGPDTRNYLRIPYLMEIEFTATGAPKCGVRT